MTCQQAQWSGRRFLVARPLRTPGEPNGRKVRDSCFVTHENLTGRVASAGGSPLALRALSRASPCHVVRYAVQDSLLPFVMLRQAGQKKKTEGLQYQKPRDS